MVDTVGIVNTVSMVSIVDTVTGLHSIDWDDTHVPLVPYTCDKDRREVWLTYTHKKASVKYHAIDLDCIVHVGTVRCRSTYRGELLAVEKVLSLYGSGITLYTTSDYICSTSVHR